MLRFNRPVFLLLAAAELTWAQASLPVKWEELTAVDFVKAIEKAQGACVLPAGVLEKHGPHLPLGTDVINARWISVHGAQEEYAVVFPEYYFGEIFEATHEPGTVAYSPRLLLELMQETVGQMAKNGCKRIIIVNGHGGNTQMLQYFLLTQLSSPRDYVVYAFQPNVSNAAGRPPLKSARDGHAGEAETSSVMVSRPDLVHLDRAASQSGADQKRLNLPRGLDTGISWYARFPEHYAGDGSLGNTALGEFDLKAEAAAVAQAIRAAKADQTTPRLQNEFYEKTRHPLETKQ
jgi:creatinine amidohydrolase